MNKKQLERMNKGLGFIAALDQSGGSTPKALKAYGINEDRFSNDDEMYALVHAMRTRIIKSASFTSDKILAAILFENTMDRQIDGLDTADYLWEKKGVVPFLKIDKGLSPEVNGAQLMKDMPALDALLKKAVTKNIFGTKERSVINAANRAGIAAVVKQQFEIGAKVASYGLVPILEPEVTITIPDKKEAEAILLEEIQKELAKLPLDTKYIFKLSIPTVANFYRPLIEDPRVVRVVALSGGYPGDVANDLLSKNHGLIASFSRAFAEGLFDSQPQSEFDAKLATTIADTYKASIT